MLYFHVPGSTCGVPSLSSTVTATPTKLAYDIGDRVFLSCPEGSVMDGEMSELMCNPSLQWSPSPAGVHCKPGKMHLINIDYSGFNMWLEALILLLFLPQPPQLLLPA